MANNNGGNNGGRSNRGFAAMDPNEQRAIARKGGEAVSQDREHMAAIGRKGGEASGGGNRGRGDNETARDSEGQFTSGRGESSSSSRGTAGNSSRGGMSDGPRNER